MIKARIENDLYNYSSTHPLQLPDLSQSTEAISVVRMKLPLWLQQSCQKKEELFCKIIVFT
jgi:hypothetical protein